MTTKGYLIRTAAVLIPVLIVTVFFRYFLSFFTLILLVVFLLLCVIYLLVRQGEGWLASLLAVSIASVIIGIYLGVRSNRLWTTEVSPATSPVRPVEVIGIYMAAQDIPRGTVLHDQMIVEAILPMDLLVETHLTDSDFIVGREARYDIRRGTILTQGLIIELQPLPTQTVQSTDE
jgi:hypothetical protein